MTIIFDVETSCPEALPNPNKDTFKYMGAYDYDTEQYYFLNDHEEIRALFKKHRVIIGFNSKYYDEPVMKRAGLWVGHQLHLDVREIIKKRANLLGCKYESKSLANLAKFFKLETGKGELDYDLLKKDVNTPEETALIKDYTLRDIKVTKEMFDHVHDFFEPFKEYMDAYQIRNYQWLTTTIASYTYKVFCHLCGLKEEYNDNGQKMSFEGGYVSEPSVEEAHGETILFDFTSLYPMIFIQHALVNKKLRDLLLKFYKKRLTYKFDGDTRQYVIKIIINSFYGLVSNPVFKSVHDYHASNDCTRIGREYIKFARKVFADFGYKVLYSDTDSVFIGLTKGLTKKSAVETATYIVKELQKGMVNTCELFKLKVDAEIKHLYFFKRGDKLLKKMYVYVDKHDELFVKGLPLKKSDGSKFGLQVFNKVIKPLLMEGTRYSDSKTLKDEAIHLLSENIKIAQRVFYVRENYKLDTQLQSRILKVYGAGRHELIGNTKYGVGCGTKYCTLEEFKEQGLTVEDVCLKKFWKEMNFFLVEPVKTTNHKTKKKVDEVLSKWLNV